MRTYDISRPPELINIGFDGENKWRPRGFNCTDWLQKHPDGIITLWIQPEGVKRAFPVGTTKVQNTIVWYPLSEELYPGTGKLQLTIQDGEYVGKSDTIKFEVNKSLVSGGAHPDSQPSWATKMVDDVTTQANRATEAADRAEQASGEEVISEAIESYFNKHPVVVEETDPTVPAWAKQPQKPSYTAQEVGALPDSYTPSITSINGQTGVVVLDAADVGALSADTPIPSIPTKVSAFENDAGYLIQHQDISGKADIDEVYTKTEVDQKLSGIMNYKGTKQTIYELPSSGNKKGDVWHIVTDGAEWAWNGEDWEELGTAVDLSSYATQQWVKDRGYLTEHQSLAAYRTSADQDTIDTAQDTAIAGKYTKPSTGIPASDLAAGVIPDVSGKQDAPLIGSVGDSTAADYVTPTQVYNALLAGKDVIINYSDMDFSGIYFTAWGAGLGVVVASIVSRFGSDVAVMLTGTISNDSWSLDTVALVDGDRLARVATTGSYDDLTNKPTIPTVPTAVSQLTNDSGFQTAAQVQSAIASAAELPSGGSTGDFLRKTASGVAWETVPSAESNSFGGGST